LKIPFRLSFKKESSELVVDLTVFKECEPKEVRVWSWRKMKTVKYIIHVRDGKLAIWK